MKFVADQMLNRDPYYKMEKITKEPAEIASKLESINENRNRDYGASLAALGRLGGLSKNLPLVNKTMKYRSRRRKTLSQKSKKSTKNKKKKQKSRRNHKNQRNRQRTIRRGRSRGKYAARRRPSLY